MTYQLMVFVSKTIDFDIALTRNTKLKATGARILEVDYTVESTIVEAAKHYGSGPLDCLINCGGQSYPLPTKILLNNIRCRSPAFRVGWRQWRKSTRNVQYHGCDLSLQLTTEAAFLVTAWQSVHSTSKPKALLKRSEKILR